VIGQLTAFVAGLLFAAGLGVGGMTQPAKVFGFLDVAGNWDPSLAFVMLGAIAFHATAVRWILRRPAPLFAVRFALPTRRDVDARLVTGAALFGAGWGLVGYCPGPAMTALGGGVPAAAVFVPAMLAGMWVYRVLFEQPEPVSGCASTSPPTAIKPSYAPRASWANRSERVCGFRRHWCSLSLGPALRLGDTAGQEGSDH
jgi:uncharacterized membrane protein YedE/YeeE